MKKILFLLLCTVTMYGQTYQNPTYGTITLKTNVESTTANKIPAQETSGLINWLQPINIPIPITPVNYSITAPTLGAHLIGIDNKFASVTATTAGISTRVWFTADGTTVGGNPYYSTGITKGTAPSVIQSVVNDDNQKKYYTQDLIGAPFATATMFPPGTYAGNLSASTTPNSAQQRWTVELYKCDNNGTPIASGVTGAPVGDLGVTVILILDSGLLTLADGSVTNVQASGNLGAGGLSMAVGQRIRYHVSAEKVGTVASNITQSVYYGTSYNSFIDVPVPLNTTAVQNLSAVSGITATDALNNLYTPILPLNTAYVETTGNNTTAQLGNINRPFLTIDAALDALPTSGGVIKIGVGTFASPTVAKIKSNTAFIGSKEPVANYTSTFSTPTARPTITAPTALIDGTILNGQFRIEDRNNIRIENLGVDVGKTWIDTYNSGIAVNGIAVLSTVSTTPCRNITVNNATALGYSPTALFHAFVFQHVTDSHFSNLTSFYNTHGLVIKGTNVTVDGLNAHSHSTDGLNIKSDVYAPCSDVSVSNINISSLSVYESGGIALDEGGSGAPPLERIDLSNLNLKYVKYGIINVNKVYNVNISNFNLYDSETTGINFGGGNVDKINLSGVNIVKTTTEGVRISLSGSAVININNSNVSDATTTGYDLTTAGTSAINIVNSNTLNTTASYLITGSGVYGNSNFGTGTKTGIINFKSQSITDSASGINFFTGLAAQTVNMLTLSTGTISFANANTSTSPTIYSKSLNTRGLLVMTGTPDVNTSADMEFGVRENDNTDFTTLTSTAFRFTRFGTTLVDILRNGNTTFTGNISAPLFTGTATLTGDPKAPTATAGDNDTSIATTAFVTGAIATADAGNVKLTGNQTISGFKSFLDTGALSSSVEVVKSKTSGSLVTIYTGATNAGGTLLELNSTTGNSASNVAKLLVINSGSASLGMPLTIQNNSVDTFTVNKTGDIVGNNVTLTGVLKLKAYTVGTLPAGTVGDMAYVTDATAPTYNGTLTGGGAVKIPVFYDGTAWKAH